MKVNIFVDMDGVLSVYERGIEAFMNKEGFFLNRPPIHEAIQLVKALTKEDYNIFILSSVIDTPYCVPEKNAWLDKHLPEIKEENRIFLPFGVVKQDAARRATATQGAVNVLLDDYSENLHHWKLPGALPIKFMNGINGRFETWAATGGNSIHYISPLEENLKIIKELIQMTSAAMEGIPGTVTILTHPLIEHKLGILRDKNTNTRDFGMLLDEIAGLMAYEITRDLPTKEKEIETPMAAMTVQEISKEMILVPILRAGLAMVDGIRALLPTAKVAYVGLYRDKDTLEPVEYYVKLPDMKNSVVMVVDPLLATGGSASAAIDILKREGATDIKLVSVIGTEQGYRYVRGKHPDVDIYLAAKDPVLNDIGYIEPGLGDAGDRYTGVK